MTTTSLKVNVEFSQTVSLPNGGSVEVAVDEVAVEFSRLLGTGLVMVEAWEVSDRSGFIGSHSTISASKDEQGRWLGSLTTRRLPAEIEAIPFSDERVKAVREFHQALDLAAQIAIATVVIPWHEQPLTLRGGEGTIQFSSQDAAEAWLAKVK